MTMITGPVAAEESPVPDSSGFASLGLPQTLLKALAAMGFSEPTPIQKQAIPALLAGRDILGQAQTGTGKTAAFALPLLARLSLARRAPQLLILAPTRELALQVSEACSQFARALPGLSLTTLYGGQPYGQQLRELSRGPQVVVGTPGRVMDHLRRGSLELSGLEAVVLDEADEMLRMGFVDDVEWILEQAPERRQVALFSATMPPLVRRVAERHLNDPLRVTIAARTSTAETIRQRYCVVDGARKPEALLRLLACEPVNAGIVFVRTKSASTELAQYLVEQGYACEALNGDIPQRQRESTVDRLRRGRIDLLVATDVVARGLDVERISHVFNYDIPNDPESYVHRIGRTGRAGRTGEAILLVSHRERRALRGIERLTRQPIAAMDLPGTEAVNQARLARLQGRIEKVLEDEAALSPFQHAVDQLLEQDEVEPRRLAAALLRLAQGDRALFLEDTPRPAPRMRKNDHATQRGQIPMSRYRVAVGRRHGVRPANIVGAIANEARLESRHIGRIEIHEDHSLVDLPQGMPRGVLETLRRARVAGQRLEIQRQRDNTPREITRPRLGIRDKGTN